MGRKKLTEKQIEERLEAAFNSRIMPIPESGCHIWMGNITEAGYGTIRASKKVVYAHRYSWEREHGVIPDGMFVCHKCDIPCCVNPDHLFLGTQLDNMKDMDKKGRRVTNAQKGERQGSAKLTENQVIEIIEHLKNKVSYDKLSIQYSVSKQTIFRIKHAKQHGGWAHVIR